MDYGMIGKIEKAKRYAEDRNRIVFENFKATFDGENNPHTVECSHPGHPARAHCQRSTA